MAEPSDLTRRRAAAMLAGLPLLMAALDEARAEDAPCFDPNTLPPAQKSLRRSLGFKIVSPDPKKRCGLCAFFTVSNNACGKCGLLSGGPVSQTNVCDSWAAKG